MPDQQDPRRQSDNARQPVVPRADVKLWHAINRYAETCGGDPASNVYGNTTRQQAVAEIEGLLYSRDAAAEARGRREAEDRIAAQAAEDERFEPELIRSLRALAKLPNDDTWTDKPELNAGLARSTLQWLDSTRSAWAIRRLDEYLQEKQEAERECEARGRLLERADVAKLARKHADLLGHEGDALSWLADAIERGDHLTSAAEPPPPEQKCSACGGNRQRWQIGLAGSPVYQECERCHGTGKEPK